MLLAALLLLGSCSLFRQDKEIVAQVGDEKLSMEELKSNFTDTQWKALTTEQKKEYVQQWINLTLLSEEAEKQGLDGEKQIKSRIRYAEQKVLSNALIASRLAVEEISEVEMFNYYRIHQGEFSKPLLNYKVQRIYLTDVNKLNQVKAEIMSGMKFEDAAKVYSQEPQGQSGGFIGTVSPDGPDSTIWQAVSKVKLNELTNLRAGGGYYLLRSYMEEENVGQTGFEGAKEEIRRRILEERRRQVYEDLLKELKSKTDIYMMM